MKSDCERWAIVGTQQFVGDADGPRVFASKRDAEMYRLILRHPRDWHTVKVRVTISTVEDGE